MNSKANNILIVEDSDDFRFVIETADGPAEKKTQDMNARAFLRKPIQDIEELVSTTMRFCT